MPLNSLETDEYTSAIFKLVACTWMIDNFPFILYTKFKFFNLSLIYTFWWFDFICHKECISACQIMISDTLQGDYRGGSSFFPRGGGLTHRFWLFYEPRSGEPIFLAILRAAKRRADFFWAILRAAKRRADFFGLFWTSVSDVFLASTNAMETMITSLAAQGGGGGVKPYCLRLSLRQSAIGTYCVGLDILWWRFSMHIKFLLGSPRGGGGFKPPKPPPP